MASTAHSPLIHLLMITFLFYSMSALVRVDASDNLIDKICNLAQNFEFCESTLKSKPAASKADLDELAIISILLATAQARFTKYIVNELLYNESEPVTKVKLAYCLRDYATAVDRFKAAYRLTHLKAYLGMIPLVKDGMKAGIACEDGFKNPPIRKSPLTDNNHQTIWLADIELVILGLLV